jgi:hypothetical protein
MHLDTENLYLYIHYNMPVLTLWDPRPAVISWLHKRSHRQIYRPKGKKQEYFRGVFVEAHETDSGPEKTRSISGNIEMGNVVANELQIGKLKTF